MDVLYWILKYTPFWAVPLMMICLQYAYIYWLKVVRRVSMLFASVAAVCFFFIVFYLVAGGHDGVVHLLDQLLDPTF